MAESNYNPTFQDARRDLSSTADNAAGIAGEMADRASDAASRATKTVTDYFEKNDAKAMMKDLNSYVKSHPTQALVAAAAVGFCVAAWLRRR